MREPPSQDASRSRPDHEAGSGRLLATNHPGQQLEARNRLQTARMREAARWRRRNGAGRCFPRHRFEDELDALIRPGIDWDSPELRGLIRDAWEHS